MPTLNACDFAYPPSSISIEEFYRRLAEAGIRIVQRYLWRGGKGLTLREMAAAKAVGIGFAYGFEGYASNWRGGAAQGVKDAAEAAAIAEAMGISHGTPIFYAVDEDAAGLGKLDTAVAYIHAANRPEYPARAYGQYALAEALKLPTFQTYAWSNGNVSKYAALYQWHNSQPLAGGTVDYGEIRDAAALNYHPTPGPADILEWIMTLPGAPKGLTYQQLLHDIASTVWHGEQIDNPNPADRAKNPTWAAATVIETTYNHVKHIGSGVS